MLTLFRLKGNLAYGECVKNIFFNSLSSNSIIETKNKFLNYRQPDLNDIKVVYPSCS